MSTIKRIFVLLDTFYNNLTNFQDLDGSLLEDGNTNISD